MGRDTNGDSNPFLLPGPAPPHSAGPGHRTLDVWRELGPGPHTAISRGVTEGPHLTVLTCKVGAMVIHSAPEHLPCRLRKKEL